MKESEKELMDRVWSELCKVPSDETVMIGAMLEEDSAKSEAFWDGTVQKCAEQGQKCTESDQ